MRKWKFSESKIATLIKKAEAGRKVSDICREQGISSATFYQWRTSRQKRVIPPKNNWGFK